MLGVELNTKCCEVAVVNVVENVDCFRVELVGSKIADVSKITEVIVSNTSEGTTDITGMTYGMEQWELSLC